MTTKMQKEPDVVLDKAPEADPAICQCQDVQRRWDGDGILEKVDGVTWYRCAVCGKRYQ